MKIEVGVGTIALVLFTACGPRGVDLGGGDDRPGDPGEAGGVSGAHPVGGSGGYAGTGGAPSCRKERLQTTECQPAYRFVEYGEQACSTLLGGTLTDLWFELCLEPEGTAFAATILCCDDTGVGGTGAGGFAGSAPVGGSSSGSTSVGGTSAGGSSYGGTAGDVAGGTSAGGASAGYGGTAGGPAGGTSAGGASGGFAGSISTGGSAGLPGNGCWTLGAVAEGCADNDVFLGRGYELCSSSGGDLTSIAFTDPCDAYTSHSAHLTCCARGAGGAGGSGGN